MDIIIAFLNKIFTVFFDRTKPASKDAKPKCIIKTRTVDTNIHVLLAVKSPILTFSKNNVSIKIYLHYNKATKCFFVKFWFKKKLGLALQG